ncbi:hypothetical protein [Sphaerospermopsis torques-reginae]|uniref:Uncharacterized protein n=1 Tax=Sphaerospermopsis torques-reginae ITEP-024 TaxID=984208 RepID=A0ABX8WTV9_9CYAN|nr:hypothetical protein [Sphaerospermopsis torques-reginae]QYX29841.1 hypothetical protein K2F26_12665 [Sphaerospermopsis torques-reginae ITEP-024]
MTNDVKIYNQSSYEIDWKYLEASQQLQLDKQNYGADYIHLYVDDIEGDWLENWDWEDDLTDYLDAFYHHCEQGNYQFALDILNACDDLLNQPKNQEKGLEVYGYLVKRLELECAKLPDINNQEILNEAKYRIFILQNNGQGENMPEEMIFNMDEQKITRLEYMKKLFEKIHNGVIRKTWKFEYKYKPDVEASETISGIASAGDFVAKFSIFYYQGGMYSYYLRIKNGSNTEEEIVRGSLDTFIFSSDEFNLIAEYLEKINQATLQNKLYDIDALPE